MAPIKITTEDLTDQGERPYTETKAEFKSGYANTVTLAMRPEYKKDKWDTACASTSVEIIGDRKLNNLFFTDIEIRPGRSELTRIEGINRYGSDRVLENPDQIKLISPNLGIPAEAIESIGYKDNRGDIQSLYVTFKPGVGDENLARYNAGLVMALERQGIAPSGTAFEMDRQDIIDTGIVQAKTTRDGRLGLVGFSAGQNSAGVPFNIAISRSGMPEIIFGKDILSDSGRQVQREVSPAAFAAAKEMAKTIGGSMRGEPGKTNWGVSIDPRMSGPDLAAKLGKAGIIRADIADALSDRLREDLAIMGGYQPNGLPPNRHAVLAEALKAAPVRAAPAGRNPSLPAPAA